MHHCELFGDRTRCLDLELSLVLTEDNKKIGRGDKEWNRVAKLELSSVGTCYQSM